MRLIGPVVDYVYGHACAGKARRPHGPNVDQIECPGIGLVERVAVRLRDATAAAHPGVVRAEGSIAGQQRGTIHRTRRTQSACGAPRVGGAGGHAAAARVLRVLPGAAARPGRTGSPVPLARRAHHEAPRAARVVIGVAAVIGDRL